MNKNSYFYQVISKEKKDIVSILFWLILKGLSFVYGLVIAILRMFKSTNKVGLGKPVISVGNIIAGGAGKTPWVAYVSCCLKNLGIKNPVILTRGYMPSHAKGAPSDEAQMLEANHQIKVAVGANRVQTAKSVVDQADSFVLDDGFQQWHIKKDLDIVIIDATNPFGYDSIIPAGILREGIFQLKRADIIVVHRIDQVSSDQLTKILQKLEFLKHANALVIKSNIEPLGLRNIVQSKSESLDVLKGKNVCLVSGIGNPESFRKTIESLGANIVKEFMFEDHCLYQNGEWENVANYLSGSQIDYIITTDKDRLKLSRIVSDEYINLFSLEMIISIPEISDEEKFNARLHSLVS